MAGKLCPQCKHRTLFVSGDNERTCTNCGYTERIDFFLPVKVFLGGILLGIFIAFLLVQFNIEKVAAFVLPVVVLVTIALLIKAIIQKESIGKSVKRLILTLVYSGVVVIALAFFSAR